MEAGDVHVADQLAAYWQAHAERLARFHTELRTGGVPRWLAAVLTVMEQAGYHRTPDSRPSDR